MKFSMTGQEKGDFFIRWLLNRATGAHDTELPPPFFNFLFTYLFSIKFLYFFIISSRFPYFNLFVLISIQSYVNSTYMFRFYIYQLSTRQETPILSKSYTYSLWLRLMHLIPIISFKLGHVSIFKRRSFSPLCLFCAYMYDCSVLQNFKIFSHLLLQFSYSTLPLTEVEFESCVECNYFNDRARKVRKKNPKGYKIKSGKVFRTFLSLSLIEVITFGSTQLCKVLDNGKTWICVRLDVSHNRKLNDS